MGIGTGIAIAGTVVGCGIAFMGHDFGHNFGSGTLDNLRKDPVYVKGPVAGVLLKVGGKSSSNAKFEAKWSDNKGSRLQQLEAEGSDDALEQACNLGADYVRKCTYDGHRMVSCKLYLVPREGRNS